MFNIQNYSSFLLAILVFQLIPGAGTIAILNATARNGVAAGLAAVMGTLLGDFIFVYAAAAGLAAVLRAHPFLFQVLQWMGAAYLIWMGLQLLRAKVASSAVTIEPERTAWSYFRQALLVSLTNPKVILFFVSFFPLFLKPQASTTTLPTMMIHVMLISLVYQFGLAVIGNKVANALKGIPAARRIATWIAGLALIGFGIKVAINNR